jgi:uncharacterized protein YecE (DUF72 family)
MTSRPVCTHGLFARLGRKRHNLRVSFDRTAMRRDAAALAARGVFVGTSSWKYAGWQGQLYDSDRYIYRGRFSESRFEKLCLAEYATVFKSVCVDAAYYKFPDRRYLESLVSQVPPDFLFAFKVTDHITLKRFGNLQRFGARAGTANHDFLNADLFATSFLAPCESFKSNIGLLIFEFSRFYPADFERGRDFIEALDAFLGRLPRGWRYGVEIRNKHFLKPDYFSMLARHNVCHVFNSWQDMPALDEQMTLPGSRTTDFVGARLLLRPGRKYEDAVKLLSPYSEIKDPYPEGREAGRKLIEKALIGGAVRQLFIYVNNRFEGNALETLAAILAGVHPPIHQNAGT